MNFFFTFLIILDMISNKEELANLNIPMQNQDINVNANVPAAAEKEIVKTLDILFKKTNTKPNIYYLPLSEEEVKINIVFLIVFISFRFLKKRED